MSQIYGWFQKHVYQCLSHCARPKHAMCIACTYRAQWCLGPKKELYMFLEPVHNIWNFKRKSKCPFLLNFGCLAEIWPFSCNWQNLKCYHFTKNEAKCEKKDKFCRNILYNVHSYINNQGGVTTRIFFKTFKNKTFVSPSHPVIFNESYQLS